MTNGSDSDDMAVQVARLEAALERIAVLAADASRAQAAALATIAAREQADRDGLVGVEPGQVISEAVVADTTLVTARLDSMIARLRAAVAE